MDLRDCMKSSWPRKLEKRPLCWLDRSGWKPKQSREYYNGLFHWCLSSYSSDIHSYLKKRELNYQVILFRSPQLSYRQNLVNWIRSVAVKMKLSTTSVHLGIYLMDYFMDRHDVKLDRLPSICLVCLLLAAKFEEEETTLPKLKDLPPYVNDESSVEDFVYFETFVLQSFNWVVGFITSAHFSEYYSLFAVVRGDSDSNRTPHQHLQDLVQSTMRDFLDVSLNEIYMHEHLRSKVAATCLLAARMEHGVVPVWPEILVKITGFSFRSLQDCLNLLIEANVKYISNSVRDDSRSESGYESCSPYDLTTKKRRLEDHQ